MNPTESFLRTCVRILAIMLVGCLIFLACEQKKNMLNSNDSDQQLLDNNNKIQTVRSQAGNEI